MYNNRNIKLIWFNQYKILQYNKIHRKLKNKYKNNKMLRNDF